MGIPRFTYLVRAGQPTWAIIYNGGLMLDAKPRVH
jgi:hypothetical protein